MPPRKRERLTSTGGHHLPLRCLATTCAAAGPSTASIDALVMRTRRSDEEVLTTETPYGPLRKCVSVESEDGPLPLELLCPLALLWTLCSRNVGYFNLVRDSCPAQRGRIAIYMDDVRPGNVLRPDIGRAYWALYWNILEMPSWHRSSMDGWLPLCFVRVSTCKKIKGGISQIMEKLMGKIWSRENWNLSRLGIRLPGGLASAGPGDVYHFDFACFLADEKAIHETVQCKGSSGYKPCVTCKNVVGRIEARLAPPESGLVHYSEQDSARFQRWRPSEFARMCRRVQETSRTGTRAELVTEERAFGVHFGDGFGLIWGEMAAVANIPDSIYWDEMHCLWGSGGIAQHEAAGFLRAARAHGITWKQLEDLKEKFHCPGGRHLRRFVFTQRVSGEVGSHIRAFAQEMLDLLAFLWMFARLVLRPTGAMERHVRCLELLVAMQEGLNQPQPWRNAARLVALNAEHHALFLELYPESVVPKLHYLVHVFECLRRFRCRLNCFSTERKHRETKRLGAFAFRELQKTLLTRSALQVLHRMENQNAVACPKLQRVRKRQQGDGCTRAGAVSSKVGLIQKGDAVILSSAGPGVGVVEYAFEERGNFGLMLKTCVCEGGSFRTSEALVPVSLTCVLGTTHYLCEGDHIMCARV